MTSLIRCVAMLLLLLLPLFASGPLWRSAAADTAAETATYVGDETCLGCHGNLQQDYARTIHAKVFSEHNARTPAMRRGCEACHGPGSAHVEAGGGKGVGGLVAFGAKTREAIEGENATCLGCHQGGRRLYWPGSAHDQRDVACTSCHTVMKKISRRSHLGQKTEIETCGSCHLLPRAQLFRNAHMPLRPDPIHEGFMTCSSCHNPHGTVTAHLIPEDSVNDACYRCHAEKRGPFLWEHVPVNENCLNCHAPHGSTRESMLKLSVPRLCQQCHIETLHPTEARRPTQKFVIGNACLHCHQNIHGSNHPSGFAFTR